MPEGDVFDAIAHPARRALLDALRAGPRPVHELASAFAMSRPAVSQHLRVLREAALVMEERVGRERHYRLDAGPLCQVDAWVAGYERFWRNRLVMLGELLDDEEGR
ncbi:MAG: ArsR/SmtB family transcription factor [Thermomicrobiales bacterium]